MKKGKMATERKQDKTYIFFFLSKAENIPRVYICRGSIPGELKVETGR